MDLSPFEANIYSEFAAGGFSRKDCTVAFYTRVNALLDPSMTVLNLGAGRGANILADLSPFRRQIQRFKGRAKIVIGADVDSAINENPDLDEACVIGPDGRLPIPDHTIDIIVSDHVFEHVKQPSLLASELERVLKPGGWLCARTPNKWGYIGIATRAIPNSAHVGILRRLQPNRKSEDVFPTHYRMNTRRALRKLFPPSNWHHHSYEYNGVPGYHANIRLIFRIIDIYNQCMPNILGAKLHVFLQKRI
jgi:SAM-dependent methyltransferase